MIVTPEILECALLEQRIFRQLSIPLSAFDALQHLKRYHGFTLNIEAITPSAGKMLFSSYDS